MGAQRVLAAEANGRLCLLVAQYAFALAAAVDPLAFEDRPHARRLPRRFGLERGTPVRVLLPQAPFASQRIRLATLNFLPTSTHCIATDPTGNSILSPTSTLCIATEVGHRSEDKVQRSQTLPQTLLAPQPIRRVGHFLSSVSHNDTHTHGLARRTATMLPGLNRLLPNILGLAADPAGMQFTEQLYNGTAHAIK